MNYLYKNTPDIYEASDVIKLSTVMKDGTEVSGYAHFNNGQYSCVTLDAHQKIGKQEFMRKFLERFNLKTAKGRTREKLEEVYNKKAL